ncbi:unnamed protein product [Larinioides sclopetarius]
MRDVNTNHNYTDKEEILRFDFFRFTTSKELDDLILTTHHPVDYESRRPDRNFFLYSLITSLLISCVVLFVYICMKIQIKSNCCSAEFDSHSPVSSGVTLQRSSERTDFFPQLNRSPVGSNQFTDSGRELFGESTRIDLISELGSNRGATDTIEVTISVISSTDSSVSHDRRVSGQMVADRPPDYSTVALNDLIDPNKAMFPVVKKENETPPPEYSKGNLFFL